MRSEAAGLDVILRADAIRPPFTGIGRYALELAKGLRDDPRVARLRFFGHVDWLDIDWACGATDAASTESAVGDVEQPGWRSRRRESLARSKAAVRAYHLLIPRWAGWKLRGERDSLYHSPNYFLPPFQGRSVATIHDLSHEFFPQFHPAARVDYIRRALPDTFKRADHLLTDAESVRQEVIDRYGWPAEKITAIHLGVDPAFRPRAASELEPALARHGLQPARYVLNVGTIEPRKNVDGLLSAYEMLPATTRAAFPLVLAGGAGWHSEAIHARIQRGVDAGWVRYLSYVDQSLLPLLYAGARVFVFPSHYEGFGLPVLEAMASGVPVVTSATSSLPEVAGGCARLVDPGDVDALATALYQVLEDDTLRDRMSTAGLERASTLTWRRCVDATVGVYERVMSV